MEFGGERRREKRCPNQEATRFQFIAFFRVAFFDAPLDYVKGRPASQHRRSLQTCLAPGQQSNLCELPGD